MSRKRPLLTGDVVGRALVLAGPEDGVETRFALDVGILRLVHGLRGGVLIAPRLAQCDGRTARFCIIAGNDRPDRGGAGSW